jgi:hypothetical protein
VDATASATTNALASGNALVNSDFETVTNSNIPDNFIALAGTIGTNIFAGNTNPYTGNNSMWFTGTGGTPAAVYQLFGTASSTTLGQGGTPYTLSERTAYAVNIWGRTSSTPAAGILRLSLTDTSNNTLNNDNGVALSGTFLLTSLSTTYTNFNTTFVTPTLLPSAGIRLKVDLSTDISSGKSLYLDHLALTPMTNLYTNNGFAQGPYSAVFSGSAAVAVGDQYTIGMTTSMALTTWQGFIQFVFNVAGIAGLKPGLAIRIPTTAGTLVAGTYIA